MHMHSRAADIIYIITIYVTFSQRVISAYITKIPSVEMALRWEKSLWTTISGGTMLSEQLGIRKSNRIE